MYVIYELYYMFGSVSKLSETFLDHFTLYREFFFLCFTSEKFSIFVFYAQTGAAVIYKYSILIEHKQECWKSLCWTVTPLHFICMFILPVRGLLFMESGRTQITIPPKWKISFYYVQNFAVPLCTLTLPSDCLLVFTAFLLSQWGPSQFQKVPSPFSASSCLWHHCVFLQNTLIHVLSAGWVAHITYNRGSAQGVQILTVLFGHVSKDISGAGYNQIACLKHGVILHDQCTIHCNEMLTCYGFTFSVEICNLPT